MTSAPCATRRPAIPSRPRTRRRRSLATSLRRYPVRSKDRAAGQERRLNGLPGTRSRRMLRQLSGQVRHRALPPGRTPGYPVVRTGRGLVSVLPRPVRVRTSGCPAGPVAAVTDRVAPMSMFDYDARPVTPGVILVGTIGAELGQGQPVMIGAVARNSAGSPGTGAGPRHTVCRWPATSCPIRTPRPPRRCATAARRRGHPQVVVPGRARR